MLAQNHIPFSSIPFRANNPTLKFSLPEILYIALYIATNGTKPLPDEFLTQTSYQTLSNIALPQKLVYLMDHKLHGFLTYLMDKVNIYYSLSKDTYTAFGEAIENHLFHYTTLEETFDSLFGTDVIMGIYIPNLTWVAVDLTMQRQRKINQKHVYMKHLFSVLNQIFGIHKTAIIRFDDKQGVNLTYILNSLHRYTNQKHFTFL
jgi:hypothetical protein